MSTPVDTRARTGLVRRLLCCSKDPQSGTAGTAAGRRFRVGRRRPTSRVRGCREAPRDEPRPGLQDGRDQCCRRSAAIRVAGQPITYLVAPTVGAQWFFGGNVSVSVQAGETYIGLSGEVDQGCSVDGTYPVTWQIWLLVRHAKALAADLVSPFSGARAYLAQGELDSLDGAVLETRDLTVLAGDESRELCLVASAPDWPQWPAHNIFYDVVSLDGPESLELAVSLLRACLSVSSEDRSRADADST